MLSNGWLAKASSIGDVVVDTGEATRKVDVDPQHRAKAATLEQPDNAATGSGRKRCPALLRESGGPGLRNQVAW
jgi:hypothetical protein